MNRQDLEREFETAVLAAILQSPCPECGGDLFTIQHHVKAVSMYFAELVKSLKLEEGKFRAELPFEEVKKRADKKTAKFFAELSTQELERILGTPGLPSGEVDAEHVGPNVVGVEASGADELTSGQNVSDSLQPLPSEPGSVRELGPDAPAPEPPSQVPEERSV